MSTDQPSDAEYVIEALRDINKTLKELVTLVAKHAAEAPVLPQVPLPTEDFSIPPTPPPAPPTAPVNPQGPTKAGLTAVPPTDALCRCMHQSLTHIDGIGVCQKTGCSCSQFNYMVAPKPTPGSCTGCGCAPAQVQMVPGVLPPICVTCQATKEALKRPVPTPPVTP